MSCPTGPQMPPMCGQTPMPRLFSAAALTQPMDLLPALASATGTIDGSGLAAAAALLLASACLEANHQSEHNQQMAHAQIQALAQAQQQTTASPYANEIVQVLLMLTQRLRDTTTAGAVHPVQPNNVTSPSTSGHNSNPQHTQAHPHQQGQAVPAAVAASSLPPTCLPLPPFLQQQQSQPHTPSQAASEATQSPVLQQSSQATPHANCCVKCGDANADVEFTYLLQPDTAPAFILRINHPDGSRSNIRVPRVHFANTKYLRVFLKPGMPRKPLTFNADEVCRKHLIGCCKRDKFCKYLHVCRSYWNARTGMGATGMSPTTVLSKESEEVSTPLVTPSTQSSRAAHNSSIATPVTSPSSTSNLFHMAAQNAIPFFALGSGADWGLPPNARLASHLPSAVQNSTTSVSSASTVTDSSSSDSTESSGFDEKEAAWMVPQHASAQSGRTFGGAEGPHPSGMHHENLQTNDMGTFPRDVPSPDGQPRQQSSRHRINAPRSRKSRPVATWSVCTQTDPCPTPNSSSQHVPVLPPHPTPRHSTTPAAMAPLSTTNKPFSGMPVHPQHTQQGPMSHTPDVRIPAQAMQSLFAAASATVPSPYAYMRQ